ncbi:GntR family transcriptional regulator [Streptomyces sp. NPDC057651]|uniref:GntR family transcriptional regulator n=1 Tax=Streptomyces sp. NPDC057651 TaxID=3346194 RepID=UPI0036A7E204
MSDDDLEVTYEYVRIADLLAADIAAGRLPLGARLPGEQELATMHGVSVSTSRRVRRELARRGLVKALPAKGTFVIRTAAVVEGGNDETPPPGP